MTFVYNYASLCGKKGFNFMVNDFEGLKKLADHLLNIVII